MTILLLIGVVFYAAFLARHLSPAAGGADSSGYLNSARLLAHGDFFATPRLPAGTGPTTFGRMVFQPLGFIMDEQAPRMAPTYPLGLPLHLVLAARLGGWPHAVAIVNILTALASGGMLWLLARHLRFSAGWAAAATVLWWLCPLFIFCALQPMSDLPAGLWSLVTIYAALRGREHAGWLIACGLALSLAVLVRPTNLLLVVPVIFALGFHPQNYLGLILGGAPGALLLGYYNFHVYGSVFTTGYGSVETAFSPGFLPHNLAHLARWIPGLLSPLVCAALAAPFLPGPEKRDVRIMALWVALLGGFYAFYFHTGESWRYLRFILPAFPFLILGLLAALRELADRWPRAQPFVLAGAFTLAAGWELTLLPRLDPVGIVAEEKTYPRAAEWARKNLPSDSAIFCMQVSGAFYFYTDFLLVRWDQIENGRVPALLDRLQAQHRPLFAVLFPFETDDALARLGGDWENIGQAGQASIWRRKK